MPYRSLKDLSEQDKEKQKNLWKEIVSYDFLCDIDADYSHRTIGWSHESAKLVMQIFDKFNIAYLFFPSGAGFQFDVPLNMKRIDEVKYSYDPDAEQNVYKFFTYALKLMKTNISEMIDVTTCTNERRVFKLPYSIVNYSKAVYVAIPFLTRDEFINFNYSKARPSEWKNLGFRGYTLFNASHLTENEENFIKMFDYLEALPIKRNKRGVIMDG